MIVCLTRKKLVLIAQPQDYFTNKKSPETNKL